jgi:dTMP kinase
MKQKLKKVGRKIRKGKFITVEAPDGCGKKTQVALLIKRFKKEGYKVRTIDFPQYYNNFFGKLIGECLAGKHGDFAKLDPKIASVLYAADRFESSAKVKKWLEKGYIVIADRYANSNQIHQGGKILDPRKRREFLKWLNVMEFDIFKISKPDAIIFLNVPLKLSLELLENGDAKKRKAYLDGKKDAHESDPQHLMNAKRSALNLVKEDNNWIDIKCARNGKLLSREEIAEIIWSEMKNNFNF